MLCRYLTWHFEEVVAMAGAICEVVRPEEQQLWECRWTMLGHAGPDVFVGSYSHGGFNVKDGSGSLLARSYSIV